MKGKHAFWVLCLVALGTVLFAWPATTAGGVREPVYKGDPVGDASRAADILGVSLSDDHGIVTLTIRADGLQSADSAIAVSHIEAMVDIDRNTATGDGLGSDYLFEVVSEAGGVFSGVYQYEQAPPWGDGGYWEELAPADAVTFTAAGNAYTFAFATSELGGGGGFDYYVATTAWDVYADPLPGDLAPDEGTWTYWPLTTENWNGGGALAGLPDGTLYLAGDDSAWHLIDHATITALGLDQTPITYYTSLPGAGGAPVTPATVPAPAPAPTAAPTPAPVVQTLLVMPKIAAPVTYPAKPVAGQPFRLTFAVTRSDTGAKLYDGGKMICDPSVDGKVIRHFEQLKHGTATMLFTVPKAYKGKLLKVHLTIKLGDQLTTRNVLLRVA